MSRRPTDAVTRDRRRARPAAVLLLGVIAAAGCASAPPPPTRDAIPRPTEPQPDLPPIPEADGPLELRVSYPRDSAFVATRGDNFIFGSTGSARTSLWINERRVEVQPNGGFLAFIPVPDDGVYRLRAELDGSTETLEVPVQLPADPESGVAEERGIVTGSIYPSGAWVVLPGERIEVGFQGLAGGSARLLLPGGGVVPLVETRVDGAGGATEFEVTPSARGEDHTGLARYSGFFTAERLVVADTTVAWPTLTGEARPSLAALEARRERAAGVVGREGAPDSAAIPDPEPADPHAVDPDAADPDAADRADARPLGEPEGGPTAPDGIRTTEPSATTSAGAVLELTVDGRTFQQPLPLNLLLANPARPRVGMGLDPDPPEENGDGAIIGRPGPGGGPYHYVWANGALLTLTGERNGIYRARLDDVLDAWSPAGDIVLQPVGTPPPASRVATVRMDPQPGWVDVHVSLEQRLPYRVDEDARSLSLTVFGATSRANFLQHGRMDPYIVRGEWRQPTNDRFVLDVHLDGAPWGYETFWAEGDDLVLRIRRPPTIDPDAPLRGLTIGVDAGHGGADRFTMGPTGYTEADANLGIARELRDALERRGARVVLSRTEDETVSLVERTTFARARDVDLWVSTHNNAFPDGVNPWENNGTSVYYNHPRAAGLAWAIQRELLDELGLRDLGVGRADLHQARFTWAPAVLSETMFMMIPEQEAALKQEDVRRRIAEAHARAMAEWVREYAETRSEGR